MRLHLEQQEAGEVFDSEDSMGGDVLIEESILDGEDGAEELAQRVVQESQDEEPVRGGILFEYLTGVLNAIKTQVTQSARPECYRKGTFWVRPKDPIFALHESGGSPAHISPCPLYHIPVFVWLPDCLPGAPPKFTCPNCSRHLIRHGQFSNLLFHYLMLFFQAIMIILLHVVSGTYIKTIFCLQIASAAQTQLFMKLAVGEQCKELTLQF